MYFILVEDLPTSAQFQSQVQDKFTSDFIPVATLFLGVVVLVLIIKAFT